MGGVPKFHLEMARHQERVAQSSAGHAGCPDGTRVAERPYRAHYSDWMGIPQKPPFENEYLTVSAPMDTRR